MAIGRGGNSEMNFHKLTVINFILNGSRGQLKNRPFALNESRLTQELKKVGAIAGSELQVFPPFAIGYAFMSVS